MNDFSPNRDDQVLEDTAEQVANPRVAPADSFVLHAPLELLARRGLLDFVGPASRDAARERMRWVAEKYSASGPGIDDHAGPDPVVPGCADQVARELVGALDEGDASRADLAIRSLCAVLSPSAIAAVLAEPVVRRLSAAGHGSIFLDLLPRVGAGAPSAALMSRILVREMCAHPDWQLHWTDERFDRQPDAGDPSSSLQTVLLAPPSPGTLANNFIYPTMSLTEGSGLAASLLAGPTCSIDVASARRTLLRVAAHSMLQDDPAHAPYGWTHCLTMAQSTLNIAALCEEPRTAIAVAATFVLGFRATLRSVSLDPDFVPMKPRASDTPPTLMDALVEALVDADPSAAAAAAWHAPAGRRASLVERLASRAAQHEDAHLAKYTLACIEEAQRDPDAASLFLAAAAYLAAWWAAWSEA